MYTGLPELYLLLCPADHDTLTSPPPLKACKTLLLLEVASRGHDTIEWREKNYTSEYYFVHLFSPFETRSSSAPYQF